MTQIITIGTFPFTDGAERSGVENYSLDFIVQTKKKIDLKKVVFLSFIESTINLSSKIEELNLKQEEYELIKVIQLSEIRRHIAASDFPIFVPKNKVNSFCDLFTLINREEIKNFDPKKHKTTAGFTKIFPLM